MTTEEIKKDLKTIRRVLCGKTGFGKRISNRSA